MVLVVLVVVVIVEAAVVDGGNKDLRCGGERACCCSFGTILPVVLVLDGSTKALDTARILKMTIILKTEEDVAVGNR